MHFRFSITFQFSPRYWHTHVWFGRQQLHSVNEILCNLKFIKQWVNCFGFGFVILFGFSDEFLIGTEFSIRQNHVSSSYRSQRFTFCRSCITINVQIFLRNINQRNLLATAHSVYGFMRNCEHLSSGHDRNF